MVLCCQVDVHLKEDGANFFDTYNCGIFENSGVVKTIRWQHFVYSGWVCIFNIQCLDSLTGFVNGGIKNPTTKIEGSLEKLRTQMNFNQVT